ncbi:Fic/DOC family N-terminal domain-containing protein [Phascolarctobacterium faecium]
MESVATRSPNVELFISMYVRKEASMSSQIGGFQIIYLVFD